MLWGEKSCLGVCKSKENLKVAGGFSRIIPSLAGISTGLGLTDFRQKAEKLAVTNSLPGIKENRNYSEKEAILIQPRFTCVRAGISSGLTLEKLGQGFNFFPFGTKSAEMLLRKIMKKCLFLHTFFLTGFCLCNAWIVKGQAEEQKFYSRNQLELKNPVDELWDY